MNLDFDSQVRHFWVQLPEGTAVSNISFYDGDQDRSNDWVPALFNTSVHWFGASNDRAGQDYSRLFNFRFDANAAPSPPDGTVAGLVAYSPESQITTQILGPAVITPVHLPNEAPDFRSTPKGR
jgi:hypothetical protein